MTVSTRIRDAHKLGRYLMDKDTNKGLCAFGLITTLKARRVENYPLRINAPCHAAYSYMVNNHNPVWVVDVLYPTELKLATQKAWLSYILLDSPYSSIFAEKNIHAGLKRGYYIYNTEVDGNLLAAGSVAVRMLSESPKIPLAFEKFINAGMKPDIAFIIAHMTTVDDGQISIREYSEEGHVAVVPTFMGDEEMINFFEVNFYEHGTYSIKHSYRGLNNMWSHSRESYEQEEAVHSVNSILYNKWKLIVEKIENIEKPRTALFNHMWNIDANNRDNALPIKDGLPILVRITNSYMEKLYA